MAGLDPAIYDLLPVKPPKDVDARVKPGHDDVGGCAPYFFTLLASIFGRYSCDTGPVSR